MKSKPQPVTGREDTFLGVATECDRDSSAAGPALEDPVGGERDESDSASTASTLSFHSMRHLSNRDLDLLQSKLTELESAVSEVTQDDLVIERAYKKALKELNSVLSSNASLEGKLETIKQKFLFAIMEMKRSTHEVLKLRRSEESLSKEKSYLKMELVKTNSLRAKLEQLCRELQKENKRIKEETKRLAVVEQQKRDELSSKFETAIAEITSKMDRHPDAAVLGSDKSATGSVAKSCSSPRRAVEGGGPVEGENYEKLRDKFYGFLEQYELREKHFNSVVKMKDLELKVVVAKLIAMQQSHEKANQQRTSMRDKLIEMEASEAHSKDQVAQYVEKFQNIEETLAKSNELFITFREEMEKMSAKLKQADKDKSQYRAQCDTLNKSLLAMNCEKTHWLSTADGLKHKKAQLESTCRVIHAQRNKAISLITKYKHTIAEEDLKAFYQATMIQQSQLELLQAATPSMSFLSTAASSLPPPELLPEPRSQPSPPTSSALSSSPGVAASKSVPAERVV